MIELQLNDDIGQALLDLSDKSGLDVNSTLIYLYNYYVNNNHN